jgi:alkanesulfonate monooxygenase SsuD/methylene tetrahydromethanopterin reductase-like flavin-dependent oxidoreductase (luciferase family)
MAFDIGIDYHVGPNGEVDPPQDCARLAEELELDTFWTPDNLMREDKPILEAMLVLAMAGAVTSRIKIGIGVMQLALRATAWAVKEVQTMQVLTGNRFVFGVGSGGTFPTEWAAAGKTTHDRGKRTNAMLEALPALFAGQPTAVPDGDGPVTLIPAVPMPPIWVGGHSPAAKKRTAHYGDGWVPAVITPEALRAGGDEIAEQAAELGRPAPRLGFQLHGDLRASRGDARHRELVDWMSKRFKRSEEEADRLVLTGPPEAAAARIASYGEVGVDMVIVSPLGGGWMQQAELLGETRRLLP